MWFFKDKEIVDYILKDENWKKSDKQLAEELNTSEQEINRIVWTYRDVIENEKFYNVDMVLYPPPTKKKRKWFKK